MSKLQIYNEVNEGFPGGGSVVCPGLSIQWQRGPCASGAAPTGAQVEDAIGAAIARLEFLQEVSGGKFACHENARTLEHLFSALSMCHARTADRMRRGVEGSNAP